jgi:hypothetical protein
MTEEQYSEMLRSQENKCAVCEIFFFDGFKICIDHCHETGRVRGLLCQSCNAAEGMLKTPETVDRLAEYMRKHALAVAA